MVGQVHFRGTAMSTSLASLALTLAGATLLCACVTVAAPVARCQTYCNTQDEGYQWAQRSDLYDAAACEGYSAAFSTGCRLAVIDAVQSRNPQRAY